MKFLNNYRTYWKSFWKNYFINQTRRKNIKHLINFINDKTFCLNFIYNMLQNKLTVIRNYLNDVLKKQWIHLFFNFIDAFVLFAKKSNDDLYFCVNYWNFNEFIIKNKYFLFLLFELLNKFTHTKKFSKIDLQWTYHQIRVRKRNK